MCTHTCMPTLFFPLLWQGFPLHKSQVPFEAVSEFHPNQKLIFSKCKYSVLMQPSTPGYLACSALSKSSDKGASKRSPDQQQEGAYGCLCSKATVAAAPVSGPRVRELWWNNHTILGTPQQFRHPWWRRLWRHWVLETSFLSSTHCRGYQVQYSSLSSFLNSKTFLLEEEAAMTRCYLEPLTWMLIQTSSSKEKARLLNRSIMWFPYA